MNAFPGGVGISRLSVYDWEAKDGVCGGSPHLHLLCAEAYVVVAGEGAVQTLTGQGYAETPLRPGTVASFSPGTVHRLVNGDGALQIVVVMQNDGLPEAGDAVFTFPADILADPKIYAAAAAAPTEEAARRRRDLAIEGYLELRDAGPAELAKFHRTALRLKAHLLGEWRRRWEAVPLAAAQETGQHLDSLRRGDVSYLLDATLTEIAPEPRLGMCGHLATYAASV